MQIQSGLVILIITLFLSGCKISDDESSFNQPKECVKIIDTKYYKPIKHSGSWICGEEIWHYSNIPNMIYYDKFDNRLLVKKIYNDLDEDKNLLIRFFYSSIEDKRIERIVYRDFGKNNVIQFIRDEDNNLLEILSSEKIPSEVINVDYLKFQYDSLGNKIKEKKEDRTKIIKYSPSDSTIVIKHYEVFDESCEYSYMFKKGLIESGVEIYNKETNLILRKKTEYYKYGILVRETDLTFEYGKNGKVINELMKEKILGGYHIPIPRDMSKEDKDIYIKDYFNNSVFKDEGYLSRWEYNEKEDCVEFVTFNSLNEIVNSERQEYVYNERGEWIQRFTYEFSSDIPSKITIRRIQYLD